jgi:hypothetical protein
MDTDKFFQSKLFKVIVAAMLGVIILTFVFGLGVFVGESRAEFSFKWANEYHNNFGGPRSGFLGGMMNQEFTEANGVFGQIIKINALTGSGQAQSLTIKGKDNVEKVILVSDKTTIVYQRKSIKLSELKIGDIAVVIGEPNSSGQIEGELIRVMPAPLGNIKTNLPFVPSTASQS